MSACIHSVWIALLITVSAHALPSYLDPTYHHAWSQNAGWVNAQPFGYTDEGVQVTKFTVSGMAWAQNIGWVDFGDGTPKNGLRYENLSTSDHGVNITDWRGNLGGYAWSQNTGWINFGWASPSDVNRPRFNFATDTFDGFAWSQNLGWIYLGGGWLRTVPSTVSFIDADGDGLPDSWEIEQKGSLASWNENSDTDDDGLVDGWEFTHFLTLTSSNGSQDSDGDGWNDLVEHNARGFTTANPVRSDLPGAWPTPPASSTISASSQMAWAQNLGWMNWKHDQPSDPAGVHVTRYHLRGTAWLQNAGWVQFGDGSPRDGLRYSNTSTDDCGVNIDGDLNLSGYAWAQNVGFIHFGWASLSDPNRPRISGTQLAGYAWAQNTGWINLSQLGNSFISNLADNDADGLPDMWEYQRVIWTGLLNGTSDTDGDTLADAWEFTHFRSLGVSDGTGDFDQDGSLDREEFLASTNPRDVFSIPPPTGSSIASGNGRHAWGQNVGWINFKHDRPQAPSGVIVREYFLSGQAWGQNIGWISLGNGMPDNGIRYSNSVASDCGVNHDGAGNLSGFAWSQNAGWINFGWASGSHVDRPRIVLGNGTFKGFAWSQNTGWINLSEGLQTLSIDLVDTDGDGIDDAWERERFGGLSIATAISDTDQDDMSDLREFEAGTNPLDPASTLRIVSHSIDSSFTAASLTFTSSATRLYRVNSSPDLFNWQPSFMGWMNGQAGTTQLFDFLQGPQPRYFFSISAKRPLTP